MRFPMILRLSHKRCVKGNRSSTISKGHAYCLTTNDFFFYDMRDPPAQGHVRVSNSIVQSIGQTIAYI